jgi:hypothetical protein
MVRGIWSARSFHGRGQGKMTTDRGWDILEGKFSALCVAEKSEAVPRLVWELFGGLTARTLSSEVLPAFCRPIIVISISVALLIEY